MALNQINESINEILAPNELGQATTIAQDPTIVDEGKNFSDLTINDLKAYAEGFISEFIQKFINDRKFEDDTYGLYRDGQEFGAGFALASTKSRMLAHESHIIDPVDANSVENAPDYTDGKFYGTEFDNKLFTKISAYKLKYSISDEQLRKTFKESSSIEQFKAKVQLLALNTIASYNRDLAKAILQKIIINASTTRNINLMMTDTLLMVQKQSTTTLHLRCSFLNQSFVCLNSSRVTPRTNTTKVLKHSAVRKMLIQSSLKKSLQCSI